MPTRKNLGTMKHSQEKVSNPRNTNNKKIQTHKVPTTKNFGTINYSQGKTFGIMKYP